MDVKTNEKIMVWNMTWIASSLCPYRFSLAKYVFHLSLNMVMGDSDKCLSVELRHEDDDIEKDVLGQLLTCK